MRLTKSDADLILSTYKEAWTTRNSDLLKNIFDPRAEYIERYYSNRLKGIGEIERYWHSKVVENQRNIVMDIKHVHLCGMTIISEWEATFFDIKSNRNKRIYEIAVMDITSAKKIICHREFWDSDPSLKT